jgi:hypothetical protein
VTRALILTAALVWPAAAWAQGTIAGVVRDTTGGVLPGVTVEAASPVLIEKVRSVTSDETGQYRIVDLRPGLYTVTFSLAGFSTVRREGIELAAGFTATVGAELRVGELAETLIVTGAAPVVDTQNVARQRVMTSETIEALPTARRYDSLARLIPGMTVPAATTGQSPYDVGGSQGEASLRFSLHGGNPNDVILQVDGLRYQQPGDGARASLGGFDATAQEINFETGALSAEWATGGVRVNIIPKEGGNRFKGGFYNSWTNSSLQSDNFTDELKAQGLVGIDTIERMWDIHPEFGGPVLQDRMWFYGHYRYWGADKKVADSFYSRGGNPLVYNADPSNPGLQVTTQSSANLRVTTQASRKNKISLYGDNQTRVYDQIGAAGRSPETWHHQVQPLGYLLQAKWTSPVTNRLLLEAGTTYYRAHYINKPMPGVSPDAYSVTDQATNRVYGAAPTYIEGNWGGPLPRASLSYVTGTHNVKVGATLTRWFQDNWTTASHDVNLTVLNGAPVSVTQYATPLLSTTNLDADLGIFAQDQWTTKRLTLNVGLRYDYLKGSIPVQHVAPNDIGSTGITSSTGRFLPYKTFDAVADSPKLHEISPRIGVSYDLFGTGKTALKGSFNRYLGAVEGPASPTTYNPVNNLVRTATRPWTDPNGDGVIQDSELGALSNSLFGQQVVNTRIDDGLRSGWGARSYNWETSAGLQHEVFPGTSLEFSYFRRSYGNFSVTDNVMTTPADFDQYCVTAPPDSRLPGGGGERICDLWDVTPLQYGKVDNLLTFAKNFGKRVENWNGVDFSVSARLPRGAMIQGGFSTGKTTTDSCEVQANLDNPSQRFCHVETPFLTQVKLLGMYTLPWDLQVSGTLQALPGEQITATYVATTAEIASSLGRNLAGGVRTATVELIAPGTRYGQRVYQVDFRLARKMRHRGVRIEPELNVFNLLNASPVVRMNTRYGAEWLRPQGILLGRFAKAGLLVSF